MAPTTDPTTTEATMTATRDLPALLEKLQIPLDGLAILGVWPGTTPGAAAIQLGSATFWRVARRAGLPVTSVERRDWLLPHRHAFTVDGVEFLTYTAEPVLPPGTVTPGYALRLT
jgi:hypothetical protein